MIVIELLLNGIQLVAGAILLLSSALFALKTLWNFGVPYAMIREAIHHPERKHGWSLFILFDLGLLAIAVCTCAIAGRDALIKIRDVAFFGGVGIFASYAHLIIVLFVGGWIFSLFPKDKQKSDKETK